MKTSGAGVLNQCEQVLALVESLGSKIVAAATSASSPIDPEKSLSNVRLLLEALVRFYKDDDRAAYFPHAADAELGGVLAALLSHLNQFRQTPAAQHAANAAIAADQLYAVALRFGLVSFGLESNELKSLVADLAAKRKTATRLIARLEKRSEELLAEAAAAASAAHGRFETDTAQLRADLTGALDECSKQRDAIAAAVEELEAAKTAVEDRQAELVKAAEAFEKTREEVGANAAEVAEGAALSKADLAAIKEMRAKSKEEMDSIVEFYSDIEKYQAAMREAQKEGNSKLNELAAKYEELQGTFAKRTEEVLTRNQKLQDEIQTHLQKAVGASLFKAFDSRRRGLGIGKWIWAGVMLVSVAAGGVLSWWLAESIRTAAAAGASGGLLGGNGLELAFFIKLSAVIPVTFAIIFASKQYANERRTEEEYAFKSTISVSLEPYKDLLRRMQEDGHGAQAAFVEKLLSEIFDNPVKRVYADGRVRSEAEEQKARLRDLRQFMAVAKNIDPDKAKKLMELFGQAYGVPLKLGD